MKKINSEICDTFDYACDAGKATRSLSRVLKPFRGQYILGNYFVGYGGKRENWSEGLYTYPGDIKTFYSSWLPRFFLGKISEKKPTVFVEQDELSRKYKMIINTDNKLVGYEEFWNVVYVNRNNMPILPMAYWVGSDEELIAFNRALSPKVKERPIEKMLTKLILEKIWDDEMHSIEYWILEGKIRSHQKKIDDAIKYANQVKKMIPERRSEADMLVATEEKKARTILV